MVRLDAGKNIADPSIFIEFQFQYGAIRCRGLKVLQITPYLGFNSNMVRLDAGNRILSTLFLPGFNSNMVRLDVQDLTPH